MDSLFSMQGAVALVTGASSGLGAHFAQVLSSRGAAVVLAARRQEQLSALVEALEAQGGRAAAVAMDVTDAASVREAVAEGERALGPLTVLVNNAGITVTRGFLEQDEADWAGVVDTNLHGAWRVAQAVTRQMVAHGAGGAVINIASIVGLRPIGHLSAYGAAKAGLLHMTRSMAVELARHDIRVNAIAPGYISTPMNDAFLDSEAGQRLSRRIPQRRFGRLSELDGPLLLLASGASSHMTGAVLVVDGGHSINPL